MGKCPVCNSETDNLRCESCGFDASCHWEAYPTLAPIPPQTPAVSRRRQSLLPLPQPSDDPPGTDSTRFNLDMDNAIASWPESFYPLPEDSAPAPELPDEDSECCAEESGEYDEAYEPETSGRKKSFLTVYTTVLSVFSVLVIVFLLLVSDRLLGQPSPAETVAPATPTETVAPTVTVAPAETVTPSKTEDVPPKATSSRYVKPYRLNTSTRGNDVSLHLHEAFTLKLLDAEGVQIDVDWVAADTEICTVSGDTVTGVGIGNTTVFATVDGITYTCIVRVKG